MIRLATDADLITLGTFDTLLDDRRRQQIITAIPEQLCWVYTDNNVPVGYAVVHQHFFGQPFLDMLMVKSERRGSGIGAKLVTHAVQTLAAPKLFTSTNRSNTPMRGLLEKMGFSEIGELTGLDEDDPEVFYLKRA